jgi:hypothetical protein
MITAFEVSNVIMHIILISVFIGIFFFTYGAYLEKEIIKDQVDYLVDDLISPFKVFIPEDRLKQINTKLNNLNIPVDEVADKKVSDNNKAIIKKAFIAIGISVVLGVIIIIIISKKLNTENMSTSQFWGKLLKYNLITLVFIGLTEFIFAAGFAKNFMSIDTNLFKKTVLNNIINKIGTVAPPQTAPPKTAPPQTVPPQTVPPQTVPPQTVPPQTVPPQTVPPQTVPPQTAPPETIPPETMSYESATAESITAESEDE